MYVGESFAPCYSTLALYRWGTCRNALKRVGHGKTETKFLSKTVGLAKAPPGKGSATISCFHAAGNDCLQRICFCCKFSYHRPSPWNTLGDWTRSSHISPFVIGLATTLFLPAQKGSISIGFFNSYQLTETELIYRLCRVIPVFRISLSEITAIEPWHAVGPSA